MLFKNGENGYRTPEEFQRRARQDIENHLKKYQNHEGLNKVDSRIQQESNNDINNMMEVDEIPSQNIQAHNKATPLIRRLKRSKADILPHIQVQQIQGEGQVQGPEHKIEPHGIRTTNNYQSHLTYGSSPLRKSVTNSTIDSSDSCSSIDSGKSGCSLSHASAQHLLHEQHESLNRILTHSTLDNSLFSNEAVSLYTQSTYANNNNNASDMSGDANNNSNILTLQEALPHDFSQYYSPDLDVEKFSNGRPIFTKRPLKNWELNDIRSLLIYPEIKPEWNNNKIPMIQSPQPNLNFRIQIIPNYFADAEIAKFLAHSDIYKEAKFDLDFKFKTAMFIIDRARLRHKQILIDSFSIDENKFNEQNLLGDIQYDCYFKFEWRNIIENYMLNLGIEYECRLEFKSKISKLKKITKQKKSSKYNNRDNNNSLKNNLYKKVLLENKDSHISEDIKMHIWKEVQSQVYTRLNMDGWSVN